MRPIIWVSTAAPCRRNPTWLCLQCCNKCCFVQDVGMGDKALTCFLGCCVQLLQVLMEVCIQKCWNKWNRRQSGNCWSSSSWNHRCFSQRQLFTRCLLHVGNSCRRHGPPTWCLLQLFHILDKKDTSVFLKVFSWDFPSCLNWKSPVEAPPPFKRHDGCQFLFKRQLNKNSGDSDTAATPTPLLFGAGRLRRGGGQCSWPVCGGGVEWGRGPPFHRWSGPGAERDLLPLGATPLGADRPAPCCNDLQGQSETPEPVWQ